MSNMNEEKPVPDPVIDGGIYTPIDPISGAVGTEGGELAPDPTPSHSSNEDGDGSKAAVDKDAFQENTPGHHRADRALEYDDPEDVQEENRQSWSA